MDIILIGSGNTATILGRKSIAAGHRIIQVYSRQDEHGRRLAQLLNSSSTSSLSAVEKKADLMIVALADH
ncbi:MAG TPA: NAD(P)-binding domain-containing protein, partial [Puia sp.]